MTTVTAAPATGPAAVAVPPLPSWLRILTAALMPLGPAAVAVIRLVYPADPAEAIAQPQTMELVLWLGFIGTFTLIPGAYAALHVARISAPRLALVTGGFLIPGYLAMYTLGFFDTLWAIAPGLGLPPEEVARIGAAAETTGPGMITLLVFVLGHLVGTVLLGVVMLRGRLAPLIVSIAMIISQPLHLVSIFAGLSLLDLVAWGLTALGMGFLAVRYVRVTRPTS